MNTQAIQAKGIKMCEPNCMVETWEKILEYASSPLHGTMSRKLRKGVSLQINSETIPQNCQIFVSDHLLRLTAQTEDGKTQNSYFDLRKIGSIKTISAGE